MSSSKFKSTQTSMMPGMRPFPRAKTTPIEEMKADDLRTLYSRNQDLLRTMSASTSAVVERLEANQAKIKTRLAELEGLESIQRGMRRATIGEDDRMAIDDLPAPETYVSRATRVKQQAISAWGKSRNGQKHKTATMSLEDAIVLEQQHNALEKERRARALERQEKLNMPKRPGLGMATSREEYEQKVWAFMNHKPTDSDLEDDDDEDDDDPSTWFEDDQDDGVKGQDIVYPDAEDVADVIRMDTSKIRYSSFYEPYDGAD